MIFGYIATERYPEIEAALIRDNPEANVFEPAAGDRRSFFLQHSPNTSSKLTYHDANRLLLGDGIPIRYSSGKGYELINSPGEPDIEKGFTSLINNIVSNISMVYFERENNGGKITLSSSRLGPGKMYYRSINGGLAFSTDFTALLKFSPINLNDTALYYVVRYGYSPPPMTISENIQAVPTTHWAAFDLIGNNIETTPYFKFDFSESNGFDLNDVDGVLDLSSGMLDQLGCSLLLSGGIDSTLMAHKVRQHSARKINAYYLRFGSEDPELPFAQEAAKAAGCSLRIFDMRADIVPDTILEIASSYSHPFNDFSTIATYYLMKCASDYEDGGIIIDGNGGDDCFGLGLMDPKLRKKQSFLYNLPTVVKAAAFFISSHSNLWEREKGIKRVLRGIADLHEKELCQVYEILCPWTAIFHENTREYDAEMGTQMIRSLRDLLEPLPHNESFYAKATVNWMRHVTTGMWCAKTYGIKSLPNILPVYPFMWKDMLEVQGKVAWAAKVNNGIMKWPLKSLLESYMPRDFIYRKKSGFTPPFESWFSNKRLYELLYDTLLSQHTVTERIINKEKLRQLIDRLPHTSQWPAHLCNFLWGCLFTELWVKKNG